MSSYCHWSLFLIACCLVGFTVNDLVVKQNNLVEIFRVFKATCKIISGISQLLFRIVLREV